MLQKIINLVDNIKVNKQNGSPAVYKPLLLMIILKRVLNGEKNEFSFKNICPELESLMEKYGWSTSGNKKAQYPFYFLASSELWKINVEKTDLKFPDAPSKKEMENAIGKLNDEVFIFLLNNKEGTKRVMKFINDKYFEGKFAF